MLLTRNSNFSNAHNLFFNDLPSDVAPAEVMLLAYKPNDFKLQLVRSKVDGVDGVAGVDGVGGVGG